MSEKGRRVRDLWHTTQDVVVLLVMQWYTIGDVCGSQFLLSFPVQRLDLLTDISTFAEYFTTCSRLHTQVYFIVFRYFIVVFLKVFQIFKKHT